MITKIKYFDIIFGQGIQSLAIRGTLSLGAGNVGEKAFRFLRNVLLTRILVPEAFGIMAIIMAINMALESFTQIGTNLSIIHNDRGREGTFLNGAWMISMGRALMLFMFAFVAAPWIAELYENPDLTTLMRVGFISILLNGAMSPRAHVALKDMEYKKWVIINHGGNAIGIVVTIVLAIALKNVWALVIGFLVEAGLRTLLSYVMCPFRPSIKTDEQSRRGLIRYARGMIGLPILTFIFNRADVFVVGKICTLSELGLYTMAITIALIPSEIFTGVISQVFMPIFSKVQTDNYKIREIIISSTAFSAFLFMPLAFFGLAFGKDFLAMIYGDAYGAMAIPFSIILFSVMIQIAAVPIASYFFAVGQPALNRHYAAIRALVVLMGLYPAVTYFGPAGAAMVILIGSSAGMIVQLLQIGKIIELSLGRYLSIFPLAILISAPVFMVGYWHNSLSSIQANGVVTGLIGCMISYICAITVVNNLKIIKLHGRYQ